MIDIAFLLLLSAGAVLFGHGKNALKYYKDRPFLRVFLAALLALPLVFLTAVVLQSVSTPTQFLIQISFLGILFHAAYKSTGAYFAKGSALQHGQRYLFRAIAFGVMLIWFFALVFSIREAFVLIHACTFSALPTSCYVLVHFGIAKISLYFLAIVVLLVIANTWFSAKEPIKE